jgi:hypothetical protein
VAYNAKSDDELSTLKSINPPAFSGVEQSEEMLQWIWENFSAVAGDQPSFECWRKIFLLHLLKERNQRPSQSKEYG